MIFKSQTVSLGRWWKLQSAIRSDCRSRIMFSDLEAHYASDKAIEIWLVDGGVS